MYELYGFKARKGPLRGKYIAHAASWSGNAYAGDCITIDGVPANANEQKLLLQHCAAMAKERSIYGLYNAAFELWASDSAKQKLDTLKHMGITRQRVNFI